MSMPFTCRTLVLSFCFLLSQSSLAANPRMELKVSTPGCSQLFKPVLTLQHNPKGVYVHSGKPKKPEVDIQVLGVRKAVALMFKPLEWATRRILLRQSARQTGLQAFVLRFESDSEDVVGVYTTVVNSPAGVDDLEWAAALLGTEVEELKAAPMPPEAIEFSAPFHGKIILGSKAGYLNGDLVEIELDPSLSQDLIAFLEDQFMSAMASKGSSAARLVTGTVEMGENPIRLTLQGDTFRMEFPGTRLHVVIPLLP